MEKPSKKAKKNNIQKLSEPPYDKISGQYTEIEPKIQFNTNNVPSKYNTNLEELEKKLFKQRFSGLEKDWPDWKRNFTTILELRGLIELIQPTFKLEKGSPEERARKSEANKTLYLILLVTLDGSNSDKISNSFRNDGIKSWNYIKSLYERTESYEIVNAIIALTQIKYKDNMQEYIAEIRTLIGKLNNAFDTPVLNEQIHCTFLLLGLPQNLRDMLTNKYPDPRKFKLAYFEVDLLSVRSKQILDSNSTFTNPSSNPPISSENMKKENNNLFKNKKMIKSKQETKNTNTKKDKWCDICKSDTHWTDYCFNNPKNPNNRLNLSQRDTKEFKNKETANLVIDSTSLRAKQILISNAESNTSSSNSNMWIIDSGATAHVCNDRNRFNNYKEVKNRGIEVATKEISKVYGIGDIITEFKSNDSTITLELRDVLHVPNFTKNLISVDEIFMQGHDVDFKQKHQAILVDANEEKKINMERINKLWHVREVDSFITNDKAYYTNAPDDVYLWHQRLGHQNFQMIFKLKDQVHGLKLPNIPYSDIKNFQCEICQLTKFKKIPFQKEHVATRAKKPLELIHTDIGYLIHTTWFGEKYVISFIDDYTRLQKLYLMKTKSSEEALEKFKEYLNYVGRYHRTEYKTLRADGGGEFTSKDFKQFCKNNKIHQQFTTPHTPEQNGVAERNWETINNMVRGMIKDAKLDERWCGLATLMAAEIRNQSLTNGLKSAKTPYEMFYGKKPDLNKLRKFGSVAYVKNESPNIRKADDKSFKSIFLGFDDHTKGYIVYDLKNDRIKISRNVSFAEHLEVPPIDTSITPKIEFNETEPESRVESSYGKSEPSSTTTSASDTQISNTNTTNRLSSDDITKNDMESLLENNRRTRSRITKGNKDPDYQYGNWWESLELDDSNDKIDYANISTIGIYIPNNYNEASKYEEWNDAMTKEYNSLIENNTWELTSLPHGRSAIGCKWVYKIKQDSNGNIIKYKARLVAKGYTQKQGIDFSETFAPTVKYNTIRLMIAIAALKGYSITQLDISNAYLHADIDEDIYMEQPEGFKKENKGEKLYCKLRKSIYGLKQSARNWNSLLDKWFKSNGFIQSIKEPCLYTHNKDGIYLALAIYVDDIIIISNNQDYRNKLVSKMQESFKLIDSGQATWILGMSIKQDKDNIYINQQKYINDILKKYKMENCKPQPIPIVKEELLKKTPSPKSKDEKVDKHTYMQMVGSLIYLSTISRPDIAFAVSKIAQNMSNPTQHDWVRAKRILRYLQGTKDIQLCFSKNGNSELIGYSDADWAGATNRKSTGGYLFMLAGAPISWSSKLQDTTALSTMEAELISNCEATKEAYLLKQLLSDLNYEIKSPINIFTDNQSTIKFIENGALKRQTKHIDIKYYFVREAYINKITKYTYISSENMVADILTKPVERVTLSRCKQHLFGNKPSKIEEEC
jgi:hypothetical protein